MSQSTIRPLLLLIEDSDDDAFFFSRALNKTGVPCTLKHLRDGETAVRYLRDSLSNADERPPVPDLVFLDLKLPTYNGFEILQWMREQTISPPLDVTVLSGSDHRGDLERAYALGATDYCVKPVSTEQLRARLQQWHEIHRESTSVGTTAQATPAGSEKRAP